jgi:hypothetical protein
MGLGTALKGPPPGHAETPASPTNRDLKMPFGERSLSDVGSNLLLRHNLSRRLHTYGAQDQNRHTGTGVMSMLKPQEDKPFDDPQPGTAAAIAQGCSCVLEEWDGKRRAVRSTPGSPGIESF